MLVCRGLLYLSSTFCFPYICFRLISRGFYTYGCCHPCILNYRNQTERDVMFVLLDCSIQEKTFNPFYCHLSIKLSSVDRKYKIANQFCIWDKLKLTSEMEVNILFIDNDDSEGTLLKSFTQFLKAFIDSNICSGRLIKTRANGSTS